MTTTNAYTEKKEMSLSEIRDLMKMAEPTPCEITPHLPLNPGVEEQREFMSITELMNDRERLEDE